MKIKIDTQLNQYKIAYYYRSHLDTDNGWSEDRINIISDNIASAEKYFLEKYRDCKIKYIRLALPCKKELDYGTWTRFEKTIDDVILKEPQLNILPHDFNNALMKVVRKYYIPNKKKEDGLKKDFLEEIGKYIEDIRRHYKSLNPDQK